MMKIKRLALLKSATGLLTGCIAVSLPVGCMPVPSYSIDPYVGSLKQCLDIQGTYENGYILYDELFPKGLKKTIKTENKKGVEVIRKPEQEKGNIVYKKTWLSIRFIDNQHLEGALFTEDGHIIVIMFDMKEKETLFPYQKEELSCTKSSWQKSYTQTNIGEGGRNKWRVYTKATNLSNSILKVEIKNDTWGGAFGLYMPDSGVDRVGYFRKVDLTVDDIRAMNDKAKKAIKQYDQVATTPPPQ